MNNEKFKYLLLNVKKFLHYKFIYTFYQIIFYCNILICILAVGALAFIYVKYNIMNVYLFIIISIIISIIIMVFFFISSWIIYDCIKKANKRNEFYIDDATEDFITKYDGKNISLILFIISIFIGIIPYIRFILFFPIPLYFMGDIYFRFVYLNKAKYNYTIGNGYKYVENDNKTLDVFKMINNAETCITSINLK